MNKKERKEEGREGGTEGGRSGGREGQREEEGRKKEGRKISSWKFLNSHHLPACFFFPLFPINQNMNSLFAEFTYVKPT